MAYITSVIIFGLIAVAALSTSRRARSVRDRELADQGSLRRSSVVSPAFARGALGVFWFSLIVVVVTTLSASVETVPAGHIGVIYQFGSIQGQREEGVVFKMPWQDMKKANVQEQKYRFEGENAIEGASLETQDVTFTVALNYRLSPDKVQSLFREVGPNYFEVLVESRMQQIFKDEAVQYPAIEITTKRDEIREAVVERLRQELAPYSITVVTLQVVNISYSEEFNRSIEEKQVATQNALRAQEQVKQKEYEAQQAVAVAKGEADSKVIAAQGEADARRITAQGEADANAAVNASLNTQILQYEAIKRLADNVQIALIPSGEGFILDPSSILRGAQGQ